jgi:protease-4
MTMPPPPPGQGPIDPRGAFSPPPPVGGGSVPPPIMYPPPMMMPPPYYPPPRGGFARAILTTLATTIFGLSIAMNIYLLIASGFLGGSDSAKETILVDGDTKQLVAVIPISGIIDEKLARQFDTLLKSAEADSNLKALVIEIDTPGGEVGASDEIYNRIIKFKESKHLPVVVAMGSFATSGGYYISCAADSIVAQRTTITANIGVYWPRYDLSKLIDNWGISDATVAPDSTPYKLAGDPFKPMTPDEHNYWLGLVNDAFATFKTVVTTGRSGKLKSTMDIIANGKAYSAADSLKMGLIDQIGYQSDAYDLAGSLAKLSNKQVVRYEPNVSFLRALGGDSQFQSSAAKFTVNGVNVNLDRNWLSQLNVTKPMYLWRGP